jgi:hypothetical protein
MHAVIVGISDETYSKLIALCTQGLDHSWLATHMLERAIYEAPSPGLCKMCGGPFFKDRHKKGHPFVYCSDECREKGYLARKMRWWQGRKGNAWRAKRKGKRK